MTDYSAISPQCETPQLARDVIDAKERMMRTLRSQPFHLWDVRALMDEACDGARGPIMSIAMWNLVSEGEIILSDDDYISLV